MTTSADVRDALQQVVDPCSIATGAPISLVDAGLVKAVEVCDATAATELIVTSPLCTQIGIITTRIEKVVGRLDRIRDVSVTVDPRTEWWPELMTPAARDRLHRIRPKPTRGDFRKG
jgi:metal-sulfur cluster biosynthetic enzyme